MLSASAVAKWFLTRNEAEMAGSDSDYISNLKLQKLLYYAQGAYLALYGEPLFDEDILAWEHGPVVECVYQEYKRNKGNGIVDFEPFKDNLTDKEEIVLEWTYDSFNCYSAWGLRNKTHNETPWQKTNINDVIDRDLIKEYFAEEYVEAT